MSQDQICAHERMLDVHDYCPDCGELRTSWLLEGATLRARIAELEASNAALRALAELGRWCLTESRENDCSDVDGGALQDKAIELGLLAYVTVAEPCGEACACMDYYAGDEWPHDCLRETERAALKGEP